VTKRHYLTSFVILLAALFYVKTVLELHWWEAFGLVVLAVVCVVHTIDVMRDIERRRRESSVKKTFDEGEANGET
jgi:hypothetical protein